MTKTKKISLGILSAAAITITPIAAVVSCGDNKDSMKKGVNVEHYENAGFMVSNIVRTHGDEYLIASSNMNESGFWTLKNGEVSFKRSFIKNNGQTMSYKEFFKGIVTDGDGGYWVAAYLRDDNTADYGYKTSTFLRHINSDGTKKKGWTNDIEIIGNDDQLIDMFSDGKGGILFSSQGNQNYYTKVSKDGTITRNWLKLGINSRVDGFVNTTENNSFAIVDGKIFKVDKNGNKIASWQVKTTGQNSKDYFEKIISDGQGGMIAVTHLLEVKKFDKDGKTPKDWKDMKIKNIKEPTSDGINYIAVNKEGYIGITLSFGAMAIIDKNGKQLDLRFKNKNERIFEGNKNDKTIALRSITSDGKNGFIVGGFRKGQLAHITYNK